MDKSELVALLVEEREFLRRLVAGVEPEAMDRILAEGEWTVKDVLAHLLTWDRKVRQTLERFVRGERSLGYRIDPTAEWAQWNAQMVGQMRPVPWQEVLKLLAEERRLLLNVVEGLEGDQLDQRFHAPWGYIDSVTGFLLAQADHDRQHRQAMVASLPANSKKRQEP